MEVRIKRLSNEAVIPTYAKDGDAGMDLVATRIISDTPSQVTYGTDIAIEIPEGYVGLIYPRSSIRKTGLQLSNSVGVIDSGYRGEILAVFNKLFGFEGYYDEHLSLQDSYSPTYQVGDRIMQIVIVPYPQIEFIEVDELSDSERGHGGYGHTGN